MKIKPTRVITMLTGVLLSVQQMVEGGQNPFVSVINEDLYHIGLRALDSESFEVIKVYCTRVPDNEENRQVLTGIMWIANRHRKQI